MRRKKKKKEKREELGQEAWLSCKQLATRVTRANVETQGRTGQPLLAKCQVTGTCKGVKVSFAVSGFPFRPLLVFLVSGFSLAGGLSLARSLFPVLSCLLLLPLPLPLSLALSEFSELFPFPSSPPLFLPSVNPESIFSLLQSSSRPHHTITSIRRRLPKTLNHSRQRSAAVSFPPAIALNFARLAPQLAPSRPQPTTSTHDPRPSLPLWPIFSFFPPPAPNSQIPAPSGLSHHIVSALWFSPWAHLCPRQFLIHLLCHCLRV